MKLERFFYLDGKFINRVDNTPKQIERSIPNSVIVKVERFYHPICGESQRVYLVTK